MQKYLYGFKLYFLNSFHYRFNMLVNIIFNNLNIVITVLFWRIIFESNATQEINHYTVRDMTTYYIISILLRNFILTDSGFYMSTTIKNGGLNGLLLKPYDCSMNNYFSHLASGITNLVPQLLVFAAFLPFISGLLTCNISMINMFFLICFLILSTISSHLVWSIIGLSAFWLENAEAVMWSFAVLFNFLSGMLLPLDFFPKWSLQIIERLPSATWGYIPSKIYINLYKAEEMVSLLIINIVAIFVLYFIKRVVWKRGLKRYSSIGG